MVRRVASLGFIIQLADTQGMCTGLRRILNRVKSELRVGQVSVLGDFVHNPEVYEELKVLGAQRIDDVRQAVPGVRVVVGPHGRDATLKRKVVENGADLLDTSCPRVSNVMSVAADLYRRGYAIVFVGRRSHEEAAMLRADLGSVHVVEEDDDVDALPRGPLGLVAQSTLTERRFAEVCSILESRHLSFVAKDTICDETKARQSAAERLAKAVDIVVVVGGSKSHNTFELAQTCERNGARTLLINGPSDLHGDLFVDASSVGVTAGASTPDNVVALVVSRLYEISTELSNSSQHLA